MSVSNAGGVTFKSSYIDVYSGLWLSAYTPGEFRNPDAPTISPTII